VKLNAKGFSACREGDESKSVNSLAIRIPKEIAESLKIKRDLPIVIYPSGPRKLIIEAVSNFFRIFYAFQRFPDRQSSIPYY